MTPPHTATGAAPVAGVDDGTPADADARRARVDVHHHYTAPEWIDWAEKNDIVRRESLPPWTRWDLASALALMDGAGIRTSVLTVAMLGRLQEPKVRKESARVALQSASELCRAHPDRFAFYTPVFLDSPELSLWSVRHGMDDLGAVGVSARTSVRGVYLGHPSQDAILAELDERSAVISTHPMEVPGGNAELEGVPPFLCDFLMDTTRAAVSLIVNGTLDRYPNLTFILPHGGGFLPYIADRVELFSHYLSPKVEAARVRDYLQRFYYDTAGPMSPSATPTLLSAVGPSRILYGSDWPPTPSHLVTGITAPALDHDQALDDDQRRRINRDNAHRLLPALATGSPRRS
ncbi:amidohydrolase family protein [Streptomyces gibsoniae]|uniref:Amidohydrolase family protein n=1 Tax=Streptomyces gibsoniae TaxID=3075529 RepID=A0ABU2TZ20_9ACTN|nr:amidohydrolase family protein [Streptomyces sp. DSM 41699]MDT0466219.1 amidohydrolase family protein [Streptomyces sp. DSM 41699]